MINQKIKGLNPEEVNELILVTSDVLDYTERLREKAREGIKIYIVSTKTADRRDGVSLFSEIAEETIGGDGFEVFELADYLVEIKVREWVDKKPIGAASPQTKISSEAPSFRRLTIALQLPEDPDLVRAVLLSISNILAHHPEIKGRIEVL